MLYLLHATLLQLLLVERLAGEFLGHGEREEARTRRLTMMVRSTCALTAPKGPL